MRLLFLFINFSASFHRPLPSSLPRRACESVAALIAFFFLLLLSLSVACSALTTTHARARGLRGYNDAGQKQQKSKTKHTASGWGRSFREVYELRATLRRAVATASDFGRAFLENFHRANTDARTDGRAHSTMGRANKHFHDRNEQFTRRVVLPRKVILQFLPPFPFSPLT